MDVPEWGDGRLSGQHGVAHGYTVLFPAPARIRGAVVGGDEQGHRVPAPKERLTQWQGTCAGGAFGTQAEWGDESDAHGYCGPDV